MSPQAAFIRKEFMEYAHTWRLRLLVIPILLFAIVSPIFAYYSGHIYGAALELDLHLNALSGNATWVDSYLQWADSLKQIVPLLLIVIAITAVSEEVSSGTVIPVLTGGLSRRDFVLIKFGVNAVLAICSIAVGTVVMWFVTRLLYADARFLWALAIVGIAAMLVTLLIALAVFLSILVPDVLSSVGLEMVIFLLLAAATLWQPAREYSPVGLLTSLSDLAIGQQPTILFPTLSSLVLSGLLLAMAIRLLQNKDL